MDMWLFVNFFVSLGASGGDELEEEKLFSLDGLMEQFTSCGGVHENVVGAFVVSLVALILFSFLKFQINGGFSKKELGDLLLEFPIDLSAAITTLLATLYKRMDQYVYMAIILFSIVVACICCAIRKNAIEKMDNYSHLEYALLGILSMVLVVVWIVCLTYIIY